ncbi:MAG: DNA polymerase I [Bacilli bacterium]|nr:DNA polymerase I [Bacilli bacterium]
MDKIILIDGNNLVFRSYYATAYSGSLMKNSKGYPTNALYGLINMLNKIIKEENPTHMMIAFDKGKTFRHDSYPEYKAGRSETPDELKMQFSKAKELVTAMGINYMEIDNYEADDIIGTFANYIDNTPDLEGLIVSSDKDLIQLISDKVIMKLLKSNDYIMMDKDKFKEVYGIDDPKKMIDLKALMGDASDNIPGVKGIGEKIAISLIGKYGSLDLVYENIDSVSPGVAKKLIQDKENAYMSYNLATIYKEVPIELDIEKLKYKGPNLSQYKEMLEELEFFSLLKKLESDIPESHDVTYTKINDLSELKLDDTYSIYVETLGYNYHNDEVLGVSITDKFGSYYIDFEMLKNSNIFVDNKKKYTYDLKKLLYVFRKYNVGIDKNIDDVMLVSYLLNKNIKNDIAHLANTFLYGIRFYEKIYGTEITLKMPKDSEYIKDIILKSQFLFNEYQSFFDELDKEEMKDLYYNIELPLTYVLVKMEENGFLIDVDYLNHFGSELDVKLKELEKNIYNLAGCEFSILSPKQLSHVLFEELNIPYPKRNKKDMSTSKDILMKLKDRYEIVNLILDYRAVSKMKSNYVVGLINEVGEDSKIRTIYNQTLTKTGRLSSERPNLQNIPIRDELGKLIRKAFIPEKKENKIASFDYSQIELRVFASMAGATDMIDAFTHGVDIHTKTASQIFHVPLTEVTKDMRRRAKAVNFGIIYGISSFGLSEDLRIDINEAKNFIDSYLNSFPGISEYMNSIVNNAYKNGYVKTLMNRKRVIDEIYNKNYIIRQSGERMALNTPIQGTAADILKKAMVEIDLNMEQMKLKSKLLVQVHDELIFEVESGEEDKLKEMVERVMKNTYKLNVPLDVSYEIGDNWYDAK